MTIIEMKDLRDQKWFFLHQSFPRCSLFCSVLNKRKYRSRAESWEGEITSSVRHAFWFAVAHARRSGTTETDSIIAVFLGSGDFQRSMDFTSWFGFCQQRRQLSIIPRDTTLCMPRIKNFDI